MSARVFQLFGVDEAFGIKNAAPWLKRPATDTGADRAISGCFGFTRHVLVSLW
jgi:hypothetical protein